MELMSDLDPRLHAFRPDLADASLRGSVAAARFVDGRRCHVVAPAAPLRRASAANATLDTEILMGEIFTVFELTPKGRAWGQLATDGYVGYVPAAALATAAQAPTHQVSALRTFVFSAPNIRAAPLGVVSFGAQVAVTRESETDGVRFLGLPGRGWVGARHLAPVGVPCGSDYVVFAERFVGTPYLWGGRTSLGLDCSALVQLSLAATGRAVPRDSDLQEAALGTPVAGGVEELQRGDLLFWPGHVAICRDPQSVVHASGTLLEVAVEPLADALARTGPPRTIRRP